MSSIKTLEEAKAYLYGSWAGNPKGSAFDPSCCAEAVWTGGRGSLEHQCRAKPGHGPDKLYCKAHARKHVSGIEAEVQTWYYTSTHSWKIEERKVSNATDLFVWLVSGDSARKTSRIDRWGTYWPTKEKAIKHLKDRANAQIENSKQSIKEAEKALESLAKATGAQP